MHETVRVRVTSSEWWAVISRPTPTTIVVARARTNGEAYEAAAKFEACAICFAEEHTIEEGEPPRSGYRVPPVVLGRCTWCGYVHNELDAQLGDDVTSEATARAAERELRKLEEGELP